MSYDIFISHSSKDKTMADAVCHALEQNGMRCWVAPRDVRPGASYGAEILGAIRECELFLLIYSHNSSMSDHVKNEIERAFGHEKVIIPYRMDSTPMDDEMEYFLSRKHWIDAYPGEQFGQLVSACKNALGRTDGGITGDSVTFESAELEQAVRAQLKVDKDAPLSRDNVSTVTELRVCGNVPGEGFSSLSFTPPDSYMLIPVTTAEGMQGKMHYVQRGTMRTLADLTMMPNLETLVLLYQSFVDISPISGMKLTRLDLSHNNVTDLSPVATLPQLYNFDFQNISQEQLNSLFAARGASFEALSIINSPGVSRIDGIASLQKLKHLVIAGTGVGDISPIATLTCLESISMRGIPCNDYSALKDMPKLNSVVVYDEEQEKLIRGLFSGEPPFVIR